MTHPRIPRPSLAARLRSERGVSLIFALVGLAALTILGLGLTSVGMMATKMTTNERDTQDALALADAGLSHAKKLMLYSEWPWDTMTPFLTSGNTVACDGDELSQAPAGAPVGYPTMFIPPATAGGQPVGAGSYRVYVCDDDLSDVAPITGVLDVDPDVDVNKRILIRAVGITGTGASASIEQVVMAGTAPALLVNGNLSVRGDINVNGAAGIVHANGTMDIVGNSVCAEQFFSATDAITGGIPEGGAGCDDDGEVRPGSAPINVRVMSAADYKSRAQYWLSSYCAAVNGGGQCTDVQGKVYRNASYGTANPANWSEVASGCVNNCTVGNASKPANWTFSRNRFTWQTNGGLPQTVYYIDTNVSLGGNVSGAITLLALGWIDITGGASLTPALIGIPYVGNITLLSDRDLKMAGNSGGGQNTYSGLCYARQQVNITGTPLIIGQVVALNEADQQWPMVAPEPQVNPDNLVPLRADGFMEITGTPDIQFAGGGLQGTMARFWRECRYDPANVNPYNAEDACGVLWGGP